MDLGSLITVLIVSDHMLPSHTVSIHLPASSSTVKGKARLKAAPWQNILLAKVRIYAAAPFIPVRCADQSSQG
jgi:hypothetical protein